MFFANTLALAPRLALVHESNSLELRQRVQRDTVGRHQLFSSSDFIAKPSESVGGMISERRLTN